MPETSDALAISDSLNFGGYDADVLADASASSLDSASGKLFGESGAGILASL